MCFISFSFIDEKRCFELDSITSTLNNDTRKNLKAVHEYLHSKGKNNEERIWLFYGYIGTYFKYDVKRSKEKNLLSLVLNLQHKELQVFVVISLKYFIIYAKKVISHV